MLARQASFLPELERGLQRSARLGTSGVPLFLVDAQALPGAVPAADLLEAILVAAQQPVRPAPSQSSLRAVEGSMPSPKCARTMLILKGRAQARLAQWYVERANAHDLAGLAAFARHDVCA